MRSHFDEPAIVQTESLHTVGKLCLGGDWACAHGDLEALRYVVQQLADLTSAPLKRELLTLADVCACDPDRAADRWQQLKARLRA